MPQSIGFFRLAVRFQQYAQTISRHGKLQIVLFRVQLRQHILHRRKASRHAHGFRSILSNEKYKGDAIINKTYVSDCISKRVKVNNGERNKYYIENNHPAIIDAGTFARVQEEIARRSGKPKVKQKGTKTELSRYSSKYALSELLICGECRTPYRRCTWTTKGKRKVVWRCINRLDYGKKYCRHSPSIEESLLQDAVMRAIMFLYQRLIEKDKVKSIRAFLAQKGEAFYNNIIVALPDNVTFEDDAGTPILVENIGDFQHCKLVLPDEMNSICIIDGQHRIFAHYEAPATEKYELQIAPLRRQLHLLVTGLIFPTEMKEPERKQIQSQIFLDINDNTKKVAPNVLTHIEMVKDPFSDIGLARRVIERLNKKRVFLNRFELSALDESKIKVASIIKFALRYLVTVTPAEGKTSLYAYWQGNKEAFQQKDEASLNDYIEFCANSIDLYFSAIRDAFKSSWNDPASKMLSVISINGFIIAFNRQLNKYGVSDYPFYSSCLRKLSIDFSKNGFPYTSSQYRKFSGRILAEAFDFTNEELETT